MTNAEHIRAAIARCIEECPEPSDGSDLAAAVLWAVSEQIEPTWNNCDCIDHLQALAAELQQQEVSS